MRRRKRAMVVASVAVLLTTAIGWAAGSRMRAPADVATDTAAPEASLITSPVEKRSLSSRVTTRGTVRFGQQRPVVLAVSTFGGPGGGSGSSALVTRAPDKGATLNEGSMALEVSGRPVHVLAGGVPMYRDLGPGDRGRDVDQLEKALERMGFSPGRIDGVYDRATETAVAAWYAGSGYTAQGPSEEQRQSVRGARSALSNAEDQLLQAKDGLGAAAKGATATDLAVADADIRSAERELAKAQTDLENARVDEASAQNAEAASRAEQERVRGEGEQLIASANQSGDPRAASEALASASAANRQAAEAAALAAEAALRASRAVPETARGVDAAADRLEVARVAQQTLQQRPDTKMAELSVAKVESDVAEARAQLAELEAEVGIVVPANEVLFLADLPLRVDEAKVARGDDATKEVLVVSTSRLAIDASVSIPDARLVKPGALVIVRSPDLGIETTGSVSRVGERPGTDGVDSQKHYVEVVPEAAPPELTGASVSVTIAVESTSGEVLAVPVSALSMGADGMSRVDVTEGPHRTRSVPVEVGLVAEGFAEVRPRSGYLDAGDEVVVGEQPGLE